MGDTTGQSPPRALDSIEFASLIDSLDPDLLLPEQAVEEIHTIGQGAFARVALVKLSTNGQLHAMKVLSCSTHASLRTSTGAMGSRQGGDRW